MSKNSKLYFDLHVSLRTLHFLKKRIEKKAIALGTVAEGASVTLNFAVRDSRELSDAMDTIRRLIIKYGR